MRNPLISLGGTEMEALRHVWALGTASVRDVHERMSADRKVAYTTVMTVMKNLADKDFLTYEVDAGAYVYRAAVAPEEVRANVLSTVLDKVFGGSSASLVQALVQRETLTDAERADIERLLTQLQSDE